MTQSLGILHLTDLHMGQPGHDGAFHSMREGFFDDLARCHEASGSWILVVLSGDLSYSGKAAEFDEVDRFLDALLKHLHELGNKPPAIVAVPGNHDLRWAEKSNDPVAGMFSTLTAMPELDAEPYWGEILGKAPNPYREMIDKTFAAYAAWWRPWADRARGKLALFHDGLLPGEFAAQMDKGGAKFGIVGLNTAFLQARKGNFHHKLAVDPRQLIAALPPENHRWLQQMDAAILVTHHPPSWLAPASLKLFQSDVAKAGRFAMHLCGHEHVGTLHGESLGGAPIRRLGLGRSLLALEPTEDKRERLMGYQAWRITINRQDGSGGIRNWPRTTSQERDWAFHPDQRFSLAEDNGTEDLPESRFRCPNYSSIQRQATVAPTGPRTTSARSFDAELEEKFFRNSWPDVSTSIARNLNIVRMTIYGMRSGLADTDHGVQLLAEDMQLSQEILSKMRHQEALLNLARQYNDALKDLRASVVEYNRFLYPITDEHYIATQTRGFDKLLDKDWDEEKQRKRDAYDRRRADIVREIVEACGLPMDATIGQVRANPSYQAGLVARRKAAADRAETAMRLAEDLDKQRAYYDVALR